MNRPQKTWELNLTKSKESVFFDIPLDLKDSSLNLEDRWAWGLTTLEVQKSVFNVSKENIKYKFWKPEHMKDEREQLCCFIEYIKFDDD